MARKGATGKTAGNPERIRLDEEQAMRVSWKKWGPYLSERQWGTVREDYSDNGNAWDYFTHDQARSRAYRWGGELVGEPDGPERPEGSVELPGEKPGRVTAPQ